jgi:LysR family cys regulon transcriptional activator
MNFQQLRSIREAARCGFNLTEVANVFTSQPGVSRQIRELEEELGVEIFERNGKRLTGLTEPGKGILGIVERLLLEAENLRRASKEYAGEQSGTLSIATTHTQARYVLPRGAGLPRRLPQVRIALQQSARNTSPNGSSRQGRHRHRHRRPVAVQGTGVLPCYPGAT